MFWLLWVETRKPPMLHFALRVGGGQLLRANRLPGYYPTEAGRLLKGGGNDADNPNPVRRRLPWQAGKSLRRRGHHPWGGGGGG